jgi:ankyrin repeat protein
VIGKDGEPLYLAAQENHVSVVSLLMERAKEQNQGSVKAGSKTAKLLVTEKANIDVSRK